MEALILRPNPGDVAAVPVRQRELMVGVSQRDDLKGQVRKALLEQPELKLLNEYHQQHWPQFPAATECIKIGGWPYWVQTPDSHLPFLLQLTSNEETEIMFGDSGSLYVFVQPDGELISFSQCY